MFPNFALPAMPLAFPLGGIDIAFYAVAFIMILTAVCTVAVKNVLKSAIFLVFSFVATAILYLLLQADFNAMAQIMVYIGGVVIFVVFTILLTSHLGEDTFATRIPRLFAASVISIAFILVMVKCVLPVESLKTVTAVAPEGYGSLQAFALRLLSYTQDGFVLPFEIISILLLATLVGAITVARKSEDEEEKEASK